MSLFLFLDIDGVLRRMNSPLYKLDKDCLENFEESVRSHPEVKIVITSSWRLAFSLNEIKKLFSEDISQRIVGMTPISHYLEDYHRYKEVLAYLEENKNGEHRWIAVEDDPEYYPPGCNVLLIDPQRGFDSQAAHQLARMLESETEDHHSDSQDE
jgi:hypothetical protein